ncbi:hypothetical protein DRQ36_10520 [bacterium]|nr:MAG: hypothetical protein DRQ36_10520 [bacterium]
MRKIFVTICFFIVSAAFSQLLPDYACSDSLTGMFPVYYWQPEDSLLVLRWCYGEADTATFCSLTESDITIPEFVHPETGVHYLPYDSLDLSQASDELDILVLYDRSYATNDPSRTITTLPLNETVENLMEGIFSYLNEGDVLGSCFSGRIRIFIAGYASPGEHFLYRDDIYGLGYYISYPDDFGDFLQSLTIADPGFNRRNNDSFGALLWVMDSWDEWFVHGMRPGAERVIFVVTNAPPRSDSLDYLDGSDALIREKLISFAHGVPETINGIPYEPKSAFQVFFVTPPSNFDCPYADAHFEGWRDYWSGVYTAYESWGIEFERGDSANDVYHLPFLYLDTVDSVWEEQDSAHGELFVFKQNIHNVLHHRLVRVWYRPGSGIDDATGNLPDEPGIYVEPNPFNSSCRITVGAIHESPLQIGIYDIAGRLVAELPVGESLVPSRETGDHKGRPYETVWTPDESIPSGIYLVRVDVGGITATKRVAYLK